MSKIVLKDHPEYCPGAYDLHLYCKYENPEHAWNEFPWEICDFETGAASRNAARKSGWILHRDGTATCPKCVKALAAEKVRRS
ncbi:hypothetical protein ACQKQD_19025 [Methylobacterium sp. NPDC080182]|uniref:hypothetical protein n=1 Tax=Methylobacterium sp. NPDC080182 TaxID=3390590 RepID=UPI003CFEF605